MFNQDRIKNISEILNLVKKFQGIVQKKWYDKIVLNKAVVQDGKIVSGVAGICGRPGKSLLCCLKE